MQRPTSREWEDIPDCVKISAKDTYDKGLFSKIYKELLKVNKKKQPNLKNGPKTGIPAVVQSARDTALLQLWLQFNSWPGNFHMPTSVATKNTCLGNSIMQKGVTLKKKKKKKKKKVYKRITHCDQVGFSLGEASKAP